MLLKHFHVEGDLGLFFFFSSRYQICVKNMSGNDQGIETEQKMNA